MDPTQGHEPAPFEFRGSAGEWFGIWIVNLLLTIVTFGIYSAWAKVRTKRYFYQNTYVAGRNFDYHATGLQILIGRAIVVMGLIAVSLLSAIPALGLILFLLLIVILPFLLVRALRFNAQMSSWSNVRFRFDGGAGRAFLVFLLYPVLSALTLFTTLPFVTRATNRYVIGGHRLGQSRFAFDLGIGPFYRAFLIAGLWVVAAYIVFAAAAFGVAFQATTGGDPADLQQFGVTSLLLSALLILAIFPAATIYQAYVRNAVYGAATLEGGHRFGSDIRPMRLVWIVVSNAVVTIATLGLMLPWAQVRVARYLADHTTLIPGGTLDEFVGQIEAQSGPIGDAYADIEGVDIGLPI